VIHPERGPGFDLWVGGGLSTNPMLAQRLGAWVPLHEVPDVWLGVVKVFRDYGYRRLRNRARLKFLVADWGVDKFRQILQNEYLGRPMIDGPAPELPEKPIDHVGIHKQWDGRYYVGASPVAGRVSGTLLAAIADAAQEHGSTRVRLTQYQKFLICDVEARHVEGLARTLRALDLQVAPSAWRRGTMACTGIEFCKLAIVETKQRAADLVAHLEERLADFDAEISIHLNGCPNACARTQTADIGLKGMLVPGPNGELVEGFQVHLGGGLGLAAGQSAGFGRKLRGLKTTSAELPSYVELLARRYLAGRADGEPFAAWVARAEEGDLR
jgi:sulfite reductase (ferredoxin)